MSGKNSHVLLENTAVFLSGGFAYGLIEVAARGFTHISMGVLGGAAMLVIHAMNSRERSLAKVMLRSLLSAVFITVCEFFTGELLNVRMGLGIWDYSELPLNLDGQICLLFSGLWYALSAAALLLDDMIRHFLLHEKRSFILCHCQETGLIPPDPDMQHMS